MECMEDQMKLGILVKDGVFAGKTLVDVANATTAARAAAHRGLQLPRRAVTVDG
jgi:hypothetical protein